MMQILDHKGVWVRTFGMTEGASLRVGYHRQLGWVSVSLAPARLKQRKLAGLSVHKPFECEFSATLVDGRLQLSDLHQCHLVTQEMGCQITFGQSVFNVQKAEENPPISPLVTFSNVSWGPRAWAITIAACLLVALSLANLGESNPSESLVENLDLAALPPLQVQFHSESLAPVSPDHSPAGSVFQGGLGFLNANPVSAVDSQVSSRPVAISGGGFERSASLQAAKLTRGLEGGAPHSSVNAGRPVSVPSFGIAKANLTQTGSNGGVGFPISLGSPAMEDGGLDPAVVQAVVNQSLGEIKHCYEWHGLRHDPELSGRVAVRFQVEQNGSVDLASIQQTSVNRKALEDCMISKIKGWKFPRPMGGRTVRVTYPFLFRPAI